MVLFSFIIPIYNMGAFLERCLNSLHNQTFKDFEVIMINDGSTDNSVEICMKYERLDCRFRYYYQENKWLSAARNTGLAHSAGKYITFIDPDDFVDTNYAELMYQAVKDNDFDMLVFDHNLCFENGEPIYCINKIKDKTLLLNKNNILTHFCNDWLIPRHISYAWNKLYKRELIKKSGALFPEDVRFCEDRCFNYRLIPHIETIGYRAIAPYNYFQHKKSACNMQAKKTNIIVYYLQVFEMIKNEWAQQGFCVFDRVLPIVLFRMLQAGWFCTMQAVDDIDIAASHMTEALNKHNTLSVFDMNEIYKAINTYSEVCNLSWFEKTKLWLFALSIYEGEEAIIYWQRLFPKYSSLAIYT